MIELNPTYFICLTMDATTYSQILHYLVSTDKRYPQSVYDIPMEKRVDAKSNFRYLNDIENKKIKKIFVILSVFYHLQSMIYVENL